MKANPESESSEGVGNNAVSRRALDLGARASFVRSSGPSSVRVFDGLRRNLHEGKCSVCRHAQREDIERDILAWRSPKEIVKEYKLGNRRAVYRHAHAFGLMERRYMNLRAALSRIIEKAGDVPVTAWAVVAAVRACAKINARGQWMERGESNEMRELLDTMNHDELLAYAEHGTLPTWFKSSDEGRVTGDELRHTEEDMQAEETADA